MAVVGVLGATMAGTSGSGAAPAQDAPAAEPFDNGTGLAIADSIRVDPVAGGLSFGVGVGQALAGHQNTVGSAEARAYDLGVIGVTLAAAACDGGDPTLPADRQPQSLRVDSTEPDSGSGRSAEEPFAGNQITKFVRATPAPLGEAVTTSAPYELPGVLLVQGLNSVARSAVINGDTREAIAITDVAYIAVAGGLIELHGLRWEAVHRTGAVDEQFGTFSIRGASIGGVPIPVQDPIAALAQLNEVLGLVGLELRGPNVHEDDTTGGSIIAVDPLAIAVVPNTTRDTLLSDVLRELQDPREALFGAALEIDCGLGTYITVLDVIIAGLTGGGSIAVQVGGVRATTAEIELFQGLGELVPLPPLDLPIVDDLLGGLPAIPGTPAIPPTPGGPPRIETTTDEDGDGTAVAPIANASGTRGGIMAAVAGVGLLLLLLTAEADRRKMRRAQRAMLLEA